MIASLTPRNVVVAALLLLLAAVPIYAFVTANAFLVTLFTRVIILGIAALAAMRSGSWRRKA
jgi:branched-chain amino acid transport system permease protein